MYPDFLRRIDAYLLKNHPFVWRTRAHDFLWFSLVLGNILALLLGLCMATTDYALVPWRWGILSLIDVHLPPPFYFKVAVFVFIFIVILWSFKLRQFKVEVGNYRDTLLTWIFYVACLLALHSNIATFIIGNAIGAATYKAPPARYLLTDLEFFQSIKNDNTYFIEGSKPKIIKEKYYGQLHESLERYSSLIDTQYPIGIEQIEIIIHRNSIIVKARDFFRHPFSKATDFKNYEIDLFYQSEIARFYGLFIFSMLFIPMLLFLFANFRKSGVLLLAFPLIFYFFTMKLGHPFHKNSVSYTHIFALLIFYGLVCTAVIHGCLKQKYTPATT